MIRYAKLDDSGFTIVELISVMAASALFAGLILAFALNYWRYAALMEADLDTLVTRLNAGDYLRESIGTSSGMIIQNGLPDTNTLKADTTIVSGLYWEKIHAQPKNIPIGAPGVISPVVYYRRLSANSSKTIIMNGTQPYEDEYILYLNGTTKQLMSRAIANPSATGNALKTSCPPSLATTLCPADKVIAKDVASIDTRYFSRTGNPIDWTSLYDTGLGTYAGPDFPIVEVFELKLNLTKKPIFQTTNATVNSTIIRIALRNT